MRHESTFVDLMKTILNFATAFENENKVKFVAAGIMDTVNDMSVSDLVTGMRTKYYDQYVWVAKMLLNEKSVLGLVGGPNGDDTGF